MGIFLLVGNLGVLVLLRPFQEVEERSGLLHVTIGLGRDVLDLMKVGLLNARMQTVLARRFH
jgi:hypothetical protein